MTTYNIDFLKHEEIAEGTMAFHFKKPKGFSFKAGQYGEFTLLDPKETDSRGNSHIFSLSNPPYAEDLLIATRMRDTAFKRNLKGLSKGTVLTLGGPYGSFTLHNNSETPAVFLTGGIGITPVRSIVLQAAKDKLPHHIFLFYSNKRPEDAAFLEELETLEKKNSNYKFIGTMTDMDKSHQKWSGETGYINKDMLLKHVQDLKKPIYYISGPATMVAAMRQTLNAADVNDDNIRTEEFSGY